MDNFMLITGQKDNNFLKKLIKKFNHLVSYYTT